MNDRLGLNAMIGASQEMYRSKNFATKYDMIDLSLNVIDAAIGDATASRFKHRNGLCVLSSDVSMRIGKTNTY